MEASISTGRVYDYLPPHAAQVKVAHPMYTAVRRSGQEEQQREPTQTGIALGRVLPRVAENNNKDVEEGIRPFLRLSRMAARYPSGRPRIQT